MGKTIKMSKLINPHFYRLWRTSKPYVVAKGGRGSFKSSVISLKLVAMVKHWTQLGKNVSVICVRENASYLRDSVYSQIKWALDMLSLYDEYKFYTSPLRIVHRHTGSTFYFYGADDPMKLKSNVVGNVVAVWFEEAANFKGQTVFDQSIPTFIRQKPVFTNQVKVFFSYNPPKNPYDWINEWVKKCERDEDYFVDTSTYLDDEWGFTNDEQLKLIEKYKVNDPDYYRWLYLGEVVGLGTNVYNFELFNRVDEIPDNDYLSDLYFSMDIGHDVSATTCGAYGLSINGNLYVLDTYYYSPAGKVNKKPPTELAKDVHDFVERTCDKYDMDPVNMTADSADGALDNQYYSMFGIHWHKVAKKRKVEMIDRVQDILAQGRIFVLDIDDNQVFLSEHRDYRWDEKTLNGDDPKVIKEKDHTCDQFMYLCLDNERDFGLKW